VEEPIAAAIGAGVDVTKPFGNLIVDIGAGTSDIAVISLAGVVVSASVKVAGDTFNQAILNYVRKNHGLFIGEDMAEKIKIQIGTAIEESNPRTMEVKGRNVITGLPKTVTLTSEEIRVALKDATGPSMVFWRRLRRNWLLILWTEELYLPVVVHFFMVWIL
jgi:rod shape-determining protein MreB